MFKINVIEFNNVYISGNVHSIDTIRNFCDVSHEYNFVCFDLQRNRLPPLPTTATTTEGQELRFLLQQFFSSFSIHFYCGITYTVFLLYYYYYYYSLSNMLAQWPSRTQELTNSNPS